MGFLHPSSGGEGKPISVNDIMVSGALYIGMTGRGRQGDDDVDQYLFNQLDHINHFTYFNHDK